MIFPSELNIQGWGKIVRVIFSLALEVNDEPGQWDDLYLALRTELLRYPTTDTICALLTDLALIELSDLDRQPVDIDYLDHRLADAATRLIQATRFN